MIWGCYSFSINALVFKENRMAIHLYQCNFRLYLLSRDLMMSTLLKWRNVVTFICIHMGVLSLNARLLPSHEEHIVGLPF